MNGDVQRAKKLDVETRIGEPKENRQCPDPEQKTIPGKCLEKTQLLALRYPNNCAEFSAGSGSYPGPSDRRGCSFHLSKNRETGEH